MKTWLKGGLIGVGICLISWILFFGCVLFIFDYIPFGNNSGPSDGGIICFIPIFILAFLTPGIIGVALPSYILAILSFLFYFIIGAIIGLIFSKIKSKKIKNG